MVEPVTGLAIFAGSWLAKKLAKDWANAKKGEQLSAFNAASFENNVARDKCMALQERASAGMGRIGIQRIEAMRRVLPEAARAAHIAEEKGFAASVFREDGWFGGRSQKSLLGLSASLLAVDLVLPEDAPATAAEALLSTLAAQGAYKAFEALPHHESARAMASAVNPDDLNNAVMASVEAVEGGVGRVDDVLSGHDAAKDAAVLAGSLHVGAIDQLSAGATHMMADAGSAVGHTVAGAAAEVGGAMNTLGDFIGDFVGPAGWALAGWTLGGTLKASKKIAGMREEVRVNTVQMQERTERATRIVARSEELEKLNAEATYNAFKHAWVMKQVGDKRDKRTSRARRARSRGAGWRQRDAQRAVLLERSSRHFWQVMHAPLLAEGGDASSSPLPVA